MENPKIPINRNNKFFSFEDFDLEVEMSREAIEGDGNFTIILYRVDREMTLIDDIYGETDTDNIVFMPPVELKVYPKIEEAENKAYQGNGGVRNNQDGRLIFEIFTAQLKEMDVEISYGDYIAYAVDETTVRYYTVANDGVKNYDNAHTIMGYKGYTRTITCVPVEDEEFRGI